MNQQNQQNHLVPVGHHYPQQIQPHGYGPGPSMPSGLMATSQTMNLQDKVAYAKLLCDADLLPDAYKGKPANVLLAMEYGEGIGLPNAYMAILGCAVIKGRPSPYAATLAALVNARGHQLEISGDDTHAQATLTRRDNGKVYRAEWDMAKAKKAGLTSSDMYTKYPGVMLKRRATAEVIRDGCPEVLYGLHIPEELGSFQEHFEDAKQQLNPPAQAEPQPVGPEPTKTYHQISVPQDQPKKRGGKKEEKAAEQPAATPAQPTAEQTEEHRLNLLRNQVWQKAREAWGDGDAAAKKLQNLMGSGKSLKTATAEECQSYLGELAEVLKIKPQPEAPAPASTPETQTPATPEPEVVEGEFEFAN